MNENNLLPCPFCGGEAKIKKIEKGKIIKLKGYFVGCLICGCSSPASTEIEETVFKWNKRTCSCKKQEG